MPDMCAVRKRHILLVSKDCPPCEEAKRRFATKYFGSGEIIDISTPEGKRLVNKHKVAFIPYELEEEYD